jgi:hypothetical protein
MRWRARSRAVWYAFPQSVAHLAFVIAWATAGDYVAGEALVGTLVCLSVLRWLLPIGTVGQMWLALNVFAYFVGLWWDIALALAVWLLASHYFEPQLGLLGWLAGAAFTLGFWIVASVADLVLARILRVQELFP